MLTQRQLGIIQQLIPGFTLLSETKQLQFMHTNPGTTLLHSLQFIENYHNSRTVWSKLFGQSLEDFIRREHTTLNNLIRYNREYIALTEQIIYSILQIYFADLLLLTAAETNNLMQMHFSQQLYPELPLLFAKQQYLQNQLHTLDPWSRANTAGQRIKHQLYSVRQTIQDRLILWQAVLALDHG